MAHNKILSCMMALLLMILSVTSIMVPTHAATQVDTESVTVLVDKLKYWEARYNTAHSNEALKKLMLVDPNHEYGLKTMMKKQVLEGDIHGAEATLTQVMRVTEDVKGVLKLRSFIDAHSIKKDQLDKARLYGRTGRTEESLAIYKELFTFGVPTPELELEILRVRSALPNSWDEVNKGLHALTQANPMNVHIEVAYLDHLVDEAVITPAILDDLKRVSEYEAFDSTVAGAWRKALRRFNDERHSTYFQTFLERYPDDKTMRALLNERREASALKARKQRDPDYINRKKGLAVLEREQASAKELQAAARRLEGVEARFSEDPDVIGGLGYIALRSGEHDKAERYFRRAELIDPEGRAKWRSLIKTAQYWGAIDKAKRALESSKGDDKKGGDDNPIQKAEEMIAEALKIDPNESVGWVVNADIAKKKGLTKKSEASYRRALKQEPLSSAALNGLINLYADQGHIRKALFIASGYTSAQQHVVEGRIERLSVRFFREEADQALRLGRIDQAKQRLESGLKKVPHAPWLHYDLARLLKEEGHPEKGAELFQVALKQYPNDVELKYAAALYLSSMDRNREAVVLLSEIEKTHMTEGIQVLYSKLLFNQVVLSVKHEEDHALKVAQLSRAEQHVGGDSGRALALAQLWAEMGEGDRASALMAPFLPNTASDAEREPSMSETVQMGMANLYLDLNKLDESQMLLDALLAAPKMREQEVKGQSPLFNFDLHYLAFKLSEKRRLIDNAVEHAHEAVRIAEALERDQYDDSLSKRAWAMSRLNAFMSEQREAEIVQIHAAVDYRFRSGDEGFSDLHAFTLPVEVRFPWQLNMLDAWFSRLFDRSSHLNTDSVSFSTAQGFFRAEYIDLESGYVDIVRNEREANEFGTLLLCGALCPVESIFQESDGVSFALGYDASNWRFDLGTTPLGFLVEDWVGGIEVEGTYNLFDWRVEVDKRPVTGSLISFAGTQDPNTGRIWGGVRKSGIEASASWDQGERYGWWGLVGWHRYTGQHVEDNRRFRVLSGGYRRILESDPFRFDAGLQLMWLRYAEDLGEFTFGHGGYYSPQRYVSLSVPLDLYGKKDRWSYLLRASLSIANSKDDTTPFYPNDPDLQLEAEQEAPFTDIEPFYLGGSDTRFGYALSGRFEYQFDERLFIGGVLQIERSEFYAPNWAQLWIRYYFEPSSRGINVPPKPIQPYMDF